MFIEVLHKVLQFVFVFPVAVPLRNKGIVFYSTQLHIHASKRSICFGLLFE